MHLATLSILIACELLLFWAERLASLPPWLHLAVVTSLAALLLPLSALLQKREERVRSGLRLEAANSARRYKSLLEGAGNPIFVIDAESGALEEVNRTGTELLGFSREELSRMLGRDLLHPSEQQSFRSLVYQLKRHGTAHSDGLKFRRKDGSLFLGEIDARLIDLGEGEVVHCILRDITQKSRTEKEIWQRNRELTILNDILTGRSSGAELEAVQEGTLAGIMELVQAGGGTLHLIGGVTPEPSLSRNISKHLQGVIADSIAREPGGFRRLLLKGEEPGDPLGEAAAAEGWGFFTAVPLTARGHLIGVMHLMHRDRHRYQEEELRFLSGVGEQMGTVIERGRLFRELTWKSAELLRSYQLLEKTSHNLSVSEIKLKRNLALTEQAHLELSRLDRMKTHFLGMVSHEFNTPLTSIISGVDHLLQQGERDDEETRVLQMVREGGLRLKELVADLLRLIRLEARGGELETSVVQLGGFLEEMKEQLRPQLEKRRQSVRLTGLDLLPHFEFDRGCLERVFGELLLNAIRFSPVGGEIEVTGRLVERGVLRERRETLERFNPDFLRRCGDRLFLEVEVRDHGTGIPAEEQQGIFEMFYEVGEIRHHQSGASRSQGKGAGLGLALVKGMVEAHGGMVWVESKGGSSFFLLLPLEQQARQPALF